MVGSNPKISGLSVVITPGGEHVVALSLARPSIGLDFDSSNLENLMYFLLLVYKNLKYLI